MPQTLPEAGVLPGLPCQAPLHFAQVSRPLMDTKQMVLLQSAHVALGDSRMPPLPRAPHGLNWFILLRFFTTFFKK